MLKKMEPKAIKMFDAIQDTLVNLYFRYQDEAGYEDIKNYRKPLDRTFKKYGATDIVMHSRPFGFVCVINKQIFRVACNSQRTTLKQIG